MGVRRVCWLLRFCGWICQWEMLPEVEVAINTLANFHLLAGVLMEVDSTYSYLFSILLYRVTTT